MEHSTSIRGLQTPHLMTNCASLGISRVTIGLRPKQSALKTATTITALHSQYAFPSSSSLYDVLSVSPNVSGRDIKSAYRRMALKYHPDVCPPAEKEESTRHFLQVQEAYNALSDPLLRQDYDWRLQSRFEFSQSTTLFPFRIVTANLSQAFCSTVLMEHSASIRGLQTPHLMTNCASLGISRVTIGLRPKQRVVKMAIHSQYTPISSSSSLSSLYDVLSVSPDVSALDIKSAYRRMALKYHPDVCPSAQKEESSRQFIQVQEAYETLSDPLLRQDYDWRLQSRLELGEREGRLESTDVWEAQLMELIRRRSGENSSWGSRMRRRNQQTAYAAAR